MQIGGAMSTVHVLVTASALFGALDVIWKPGLNQISNCKIRTYPNWVEKIVEV